MPPIESFRVGTATSNNNHEENAFDEVHEYWAQLGNGTPPQNFSPESTEHDLSLPAVFLTNTGSEAEPETAREAMSFVAFNADQLSPEMRTALTSLAARGAAGADLARRIEELDPRFHESFGIEQRLLSNPNPDITALQTIVTNAENRSRFEQLRDNYNRLRELEQIGDTRDLTDAEHQERLEIRRSLYTRRPSELSRIIDQLRTDLSPQMEAGGRIAEQVLRGGDRTQQQAWDVMREMQSPQRPNSPAALDGARLRALGYEIIPVRGETLVDSMGGDFILVNRNNGDYMFIDPKQVRRGDHGAIRNNGVILLPPGISQEELSQTVRTRVMQMVDQMEAHRSPLNLFRALPPNVPGARQDSTFMQLLDQSRSYGEAAQAVRAWQSFTRERQALLERYIADVRATIPHASRPEDRTALQDFADHFNEGGGHGRWLAGVQRELTALNSALSAHAETPTPANRARVESALTAVNQQFHRNTEITRNNRSLPRLDRITSLVASDGLAPAPPPATVRRQPPADALDVRNAPNTRNAASVDRTVNPDGTINLADRHAGTSMTPERLREQTEVTAEQIGALERELERIRGNATERERAQAMEQTIRRLRGEFGPEARAEAHRGLLTEARRQAGNRPGASGAMGAATGLSILFSAAVSWYLSNQSPSRPPLQRPTFSGI